MESTLTNALPWLIGAGGGIFALGALAHKFAPKSKAGQLEAAAVAAAKNDAAAVVPALRSVAVSAATDIVEWMTDTSAQDAQIAQAQVERDAKVARAEAEKSDKRNLARKHVAALIEAYPELVPATAATVAQAPVVSPAAAI